MILENETLAFAKLIFPLRRIILPQLEEKQG
jgi:hypothetical protein